MIPITVDTKTIVIHLMKADTCNHLSIDRVRNLLRFLCQQLLKRNIQHNYQIFFDLSTDDIRRMVSYNRSIFGLDFEGDNIYLKESTSIDFLCSYYPIDSTIQEIINDFVQV